MKNDTRAKLIDITFDEVYTNGYQGASLSTILGKAEINKGSMYHFFASKKEMALSAFREKNAQYMNHLYGTIISGEAPYLPKFFDSLRSLGGKDMSRGCPFASLVQEMSNIDDEFKTMLQEVYVQMRGEFQVILERAIASKEIPSCDTEKLAQIIFIMLEGGLLASKISGDAREYLLAIDALEKLILKENS
jgi:TetR/AcrR family transcriptional regulator, transcriptional repressor for nem operon